VGLFSRTRHFFKTKKTFEPQERISANLKNGDNLFLNVDGSEDPQIFEWVVPQGKNAWIKKVMIAGVNDDILMTNFIGIPALAVGVQAMVVDENDNIIKDFTEEHNVVNTLMLAVYNGASISSVIDRVGGLEDAVLFSNDFKENAGEPMFMREGWKFQFIINDDLTDIDVLGAMIKGILVDKF